MRQGELLGLTWDCVDFKNGTITVNKQLQREKKPNGEYILVPTKNSNTRTITPAKFIMDMLKKNIKKLRFIVNTTLYSLMNAANILQYIQYISILKK